jgi:hypothetical protein
LTNNGGGRARKKSDVYDLMQKIWMRLTLNSFSTPGLMEQWFKNPLTKLNHNFIDLLGGQKCDGQQQGTESDDDTKSESDGEMSSESEEQENNDDQMDLDVSDQESDVDIAPPKRKKQKTTKSTPKKKTGSIFPVLQTLHKNSSSVSLLTKERWQQVADRKLKSHHVYFFISMLSDFVKQQRDQQLTTDPFIDALSPTLVSCILSKGSLPELTQESSKLKVDDSIILGHFSLKDGSCIGILVNFGSHTVELYRSPVGDASIEALKSALIPWLELLKPHWNWQYLNVTRSLTHQQNEAADGFTGLTFAFVCFYLYARTVGKMSIEDILGAQYLNSHYISTHFTQWLTVQMKKQL